MYTFSKKFQTEYVVSERARSSARTTRQDSARIMRQDSARIMLQDSARKAECRRFGGDHCQYATFALRCARIGEYP